MTRGSAWTSVIAAFGQYRAFVQHGHLAAARDAGDEIHVVLHHHQRMAGRAVRSAVRPCVRSRHRSCRPRVRPAAAGAVPASAACRFPAIASGRGTAGRRARQACADSRISASVSADAVRLRAVQAQEQRRPDALVGLQGQFQVLEHGAGARIPWDAGTCGRCPHARSAPRSRWCRSMFCPKYAEPAVGRVLPVITSIIVVLPAPLGPMMQRSSRRRCPASALFSALKPSKLTVMPSRYRMAPWAVSTSLPG